MHRELDKMYKELDKLDYLARLVRGNLSPALGLDLGEVIDTLRYDFKEIEVQSTQFDKVRTVRLDPDDMEIVNISTGIDAFRECNWCDLSEFEQNEEDIKNGDDSKAHLIDFISDEEYAALKDGTIDYIVFRIDY